MSGKEIVTIKKQMADTKTKKSFYDFTAVDGDGKEVALKDYQGKVVIVCNVASQCGYTDVSYKGLVALHDKYKDQGLEVLAFPCNQFGSQEPEACPKIKQFASEKYKVSFPIFEKVNVNGSSAHPLFEFLKTEKTGILGTTSIKWNFTKFLVDRQGIVVARYGPNETPASFEKAVIECLEKK